MRVIFNVVPERLADNLGAFITVRAKSLDTEVVPSLTVIVTAANPDAPATRFTVATTLEPVTAKLTPLTRLGFELVPLNTRLLIGVSGSDTFKLIFKGTS